LIKVHRIEVEEARTGQIRKDSEATSKGREQTSDEMDESIRRSQLAPEKESA
jgi:hypothetical protein